MNLEYRKTLSLYYKCEKQVIMLSWLVNCLSQNFYHIHFRQYEVFVIRPIGQETILDVLAYYHSDMLILMKM